MDDTNKRISFSGIREDEQLQVYVRLKPQDEEQEVTVVEAESEKTVAISPGLVPTSEWSKTVQKASFEVTKVLTALDNQEETFNVIMKDLCDCTLGQKRNALVFTYGCTNAGKTYTIIGKEGEERGILPRTVDYVFNFVEGQKQMESLDSTDINIHPERISVSAFELYNERIYDLLVEAPVAPTADVPKKRKRRRSVFPPPEEKVPKRAKLDIHGTNERLYIKGLIQKDAKNAEEAMCAIESALNNRNVNQTQLNFESSRSHAIFELGLHYSGEKWPIKITLVDLAGSERSKRTKNDRERQAEANNINTSLMQLKTVMRSIFKSQETNKKASKKGKNDSLPANLTYRNSKLTRFFQSALSGADNSRLSMILNVSCDTTDTDESYMVLKEMTGLNFNTTKQSKVFQQQAEAKAVKTKRAFLRKRPKASSILPPPSTPTPKPSTSQVFFPPTGEDHDDDETAMDYSLTETNNSLGSITEELVDPNIQLSIERKIRAELTAEFEERSKERTAKFEQQKNAEADERIEMIKKHYEAKSRRALQNNTEMSLVAECEAESSRQREAYEDKINEYKNMLKEAAQKESEYEETNKKLALQLEKSASEVENHVKLQKRKQDENRKMTFDLGASSSKIATMRNTIESLRSALEESEVELRAKNSSNDELHKIILVNEEKLKSLKEALQNSENMVDSLHCKIEESEDFETLINEQDLKIQALEAEIKNKSLTVVELRNEKDTLLESKKQSQTSLELQAEMSNNSKAILQEKEKEIEDLQNDLNAQLDEAEKSASKIEMLEATIKTLQEQIVGNEKQFNKDFDDIEEGWELLLQESNDKLNQKSEELNTLQIELAQSTLQSEENATQNNNLNQKLSTLTKEQSETISYIADLNKQISQLGDENKNLHNQIEGQKTDFQEMMTQKGDYDEQVRNNLKKEISTLKANFEKKTQAFEKTIEELQNNSENGQEQQIKDNTNTNTNTNEELISNLTNQVESLTSELESERSQNEFVEKEHQIVLKNLSTHHQKEMKNLRTQHQKEMKELECTEGPTEGFMAYDQHPLEGIEVNKTINIVWLCGGDYVRYKAKYKGPDKNDSNKHLIYYNGTKETLSSYVGTITSGTKVIDEKKFAKMLKMKKARESASYEKKEEHINEDESNKDENEKCARAACNRRPSKKNPVDRARYTEQELRDGLNYFCSICFGAQKRRKQIPTRYLERIDSKKRVSTDPSVEPRAKRSNTTLKPQKIVAKKGDLIPSKHALDSTVGHLEKGAQVFVNCEYNGRPAWYKGKIIARNEIEKWWDVSLYDEDETQDRITESNKLFAATYSPDIISYSDIKLNSDKVLCAVNVEGDSNDGEPFWIGTISRHHGPTMHEVTLDNGTVAKVESKNIYRLPERCVVVERKTRSGRVSAPVVHFAPDAKNISTHIRSASSRLTQATQFSFSPEKRAANRTTLRNKTIEARNLLKDTQFQPPNNPAAVSSSHASSKSVSNGKKLRPRRRSSILM
eukprot:TRINITY_DN7443_c0_g1_i1.p1 TRINITY_DN7443_c0_g1~~TRINITY_DN7443_c0_g1_i1.p1  ORF type:complete len:1492 (+),score=490.87 TRINITY_DN7443_c0_g1_i1:88-4563(+)